MSELPMWAKRPREDAVATDSGWVVKNSKGMDEVLVSHRGLKTKVDALYEMMPDAPKNKSTRNRKDSSQMTADTNDVPETQASDEVVLSDAVEAAPIGSFLMTESTELVVEEAVEEAELPATVDKPKPAPIKKPAKPLKRR